MKAKVRAEHERRFEARASRSVDRLANENPDSRVDDQRALPFRRSYRTTGEPSPLPRIDALDVQHHDDAEQNQDETETDSHGLSIGLLRPNLTDKASEPDRDGTVAS